MTDGIQTYVSPTFYIEVKEVKAYGYLEDSPKEEYSLTIGEENFITLGNYNGNGTIITNLRVFYLIEEVKYGQYKKEEIS